MNGKEQKDHKTKVDELRSDVEIVISDVANRTQVALNKVAVDILEMKRALGENDADLGVKLILLEGRVQGVENEISNLNSEIQTNWYPLQRRVEVLDLWRISFATSTLWQRLRWVVRGK